VKIGSVVEWSPIGNSEAVIIMTVGIVVEDIPIGNSEILTKKTVDTWFNGSPSIIQRCSQKMIDFQYFYFRGSQSNLQLCRSFFSPIHSSLY
jgi:hypothetical protein